MKSIHVACAALVATAGTLGAVSALGRADAVLKAGYDQALAAGSAPSPALVAAAHAPGSEHFWLTNPRKGHDEFGGRVAVTSATQPAPTPTMAEIRQALAVGADVHPDAVEVVGVQEVPRATLGTAPTSAVPALLVTARIAGTNRQPARLVRFVLDVPAGSTGGIARAL